MVKKQLLRGPNGHLIAFVSRDDPWFVANGTYLFALPGSPGACRRASTSPA